MTKQEMIDKLTDMDGYANEDVRLTMIDSIVTSLKKGVYPTKVLSRVETLINKHQKIKAKKQRIKKGFLKRIKNNFLDLGIFPQTAIA